MLFFPGPYEAALLVTVLLAITVGPPLAAYVAAKVKRWRERRAKRRS